MYSASGMSARLPLLTFVASLLAVVSFAYASSAQTASPASGIATSAVASATAASPALPRPGDVTLGQNAGNVLIGLTVRPGEPGLNTLLVYVLPLGGPAAAADVPVSLRVAAQSVALDTCSRTCRAANVNLLGGEHIDVLAGGASGGTASFDLPGLPAQDGAALLQQVQQRMHQLHTYRADETLGPATPPLQASYLFEAPDRMQLTPAGGEATVWIGPTRYTRPLGSDVWQAEDFGSSLPVPSFVWDIPDAGGSYVGAHLVGSETVDGVQTQVLTFFLDLPQTPVWFRLSADADGLVHRASMRAQGHFMDHRYSEFDAPVSIDPPA